MVKFLLNFPLDVRKWDFCSWLENGAHSINTLRTSVLTFSVGHELH